MIGTRVLTIRRPSGENSSSVGRLGQSYRGTARDRRCSITASIAQCSHLRHPPPGSRESFGRFRSRRRFEAGRAAGGSVGASRGRGSAAYPRQDAGTVSRHQRHGPRSCTVSSPVVALAREAWGRSHRDHTATAFSGGYRRRRRWRNAGSRMVARCCLSRAGNRHGAGRRAQRVLRQHQPLSRMRWLRAAFVRGEAVGKRRRGAAQLRGRFGMPVAKFGEPGERPIEPRQRVSARTI